MIISLFERPLAQSACDRVSACSGRRKSDFCLNFICQNILLQVYTSVKVHTGMSGGGIVSTYKKNAAANVPGKQVTQVVLFLG